MKNPFLLLTGSLCCLALSGTSADIKMPRTKVTMEACLKTVLGTRDGQVIKLELKEKKRVPVYEFEILDRHGTTWEYECSALTREIVHVAQEVASPDDPLFKAKAKVTPEQARTTALGIHAGEIVEEEYGIDEANGSVSYEFDIRTRDRGEIKLEIDAATGRIVKDDQFEVYQIGKE